MARLVVESGIDEGMVYTVTPGVITAGRSPGNTIQVIDRRTSRRHAEFRMQNGVVTVRDLGSKNGTIINDLLIEGEKILQTGDRILVGETYLVFERDPGESTGRECSTGVRLVKDLEFGHEKDVMDAGLSDTSATGHADIAVAGDVGDATSRLKLLLQFTDSMLTTGDLDPLLEKVMHVVFSVFQPDRAFIMLKNRVTGDLEPFESRVSDEETEIAVSQSIIERCLDDKVSLLVSDALSDSRFRSSESVVIQKIRSAISAPLIYAQDVLGVLYFDTKTRPSAYVSEELELATGIANQTAIAISNIRLQKQMVEQKAMDREMQIARDIQARLLPREMPDVPGYEFAAMTRPAKQVGGDYYDVLALPEDRIGVTIADVSGKGMPAAILSSVARTALQIEAERADSPSDVLDSLNRIIYRDTSAQMFVTMVYGMLRPESGAFEYANAGHPYPLLLNPDGGLTELETGGCFLGIAESMNYVKGHAVIRPGAMLVIYSDGVTDTQSPEGQPYGRNRLLQVLRNHLDASAEEIRQAVVEDTHEFQGGEEQYDDFSLVVIKRLVYEMPSGSNGNG